MKKIFFTLILAFGLGACVNSEIVSPETQNGTFRINLSRNAAEEVLYDACTRAQWQVIKRENNLITVNFDYKGYSFDADIRYTNSSYSIIFKRLNKDNDDVNKAYEVYNKYAAKLSKIIQQTPYNRR